METWRCRASCPIRPGGVPRNSNSPRPKSATGSAERPCRSPCVPSWRTNITKGQVRTRRATYGRPCVRTRRSSVDLPAALDSGSEDPQYPSAYEPLTRSYTLVAPALAMGRMELPRAESDMDRDGIADAASAPSLVETVSVGVPLPDAGGPYT